MRVVQMPTAEERTGAPVLLVHCSLVSCIHLPSTALPPRLPPAHAHHSATAKLLGAALGSSDVELGGLTGSGGGGSSEIGAAYAPSWITRSEKIKAEMGLLKDRLSRLKE